MHSRNSHNKFHQGAASFLLRSTVVAVAAVLANGIAAAQAQPEPAEGSFAKGRILVQPRAGMPAAVLDRIVKEQGAHGAKRIGNSDLHIVELPPGLEKNIQQKLAKHPHFKFAELDQKVEPTFTPNDPYFGSQWHATKIGVPAAWDATQGNGVTIGIIDTGVEGSHPDLSAQMVPGWNFYDNNSNAGPATSHGTWVAGTAAATSNNGKGVAAVAGQSKLMPLRVTDLSGVGYWSMIAQAITYAADRGVRVVNASFDNLLSSSGVLSAANYMKSKGGLVVISAGNSGTNLNLTPSTSVITVSATDANDQITTFSSYGNFVSIAAPGNYIYTTAPGGGYTQGIGTSFASPIVAATIALMMSANPTLPNSQIESLLFSTALDLGPAGRDIYFGHGRVNADAAVKAARAAVSTADTLAPTASITAPVGGSTTSGLVAVNASATDNLGVSRVELRVNGSVVGTDTSTPYAFSWDSTKIANGGATLQVVAYDAAGNAGASALMSVTVSNVVVADTTPPIVSITSPSSGSTIKGKGSVTITGGASDNGGPAGLRQSLYIDGKLATTVSGGSLSYSWNINKVAAGTHTIQLVAADSAGNTATTSIQVKK